MIAIDDFPCPQCDKVMVCISKNLVLCSVLQWWMMNKLSKKGKLVLYISHIVQNIHVGMLVGIMYRYL